MQVEVFWTDQDRALLAHGRPEVWVQCLSKDGDLDRTTRVVKTLPRPVADMLPEWASRLRNAYSVMYYHPEVEPEDDHGFDHEEWWIFTATDLEG